MARRRRSPTPEEIERIVETLFSESKFKIQDRDSFDLAFNDYMDFTEKDVKTDSDTRKFQADTFKQYVEEHPEVSTERLFSKAEGRDLRRDRLKTAKRVVKTRKEFIKAGASEVDLQAFDTARQRVTKDILRRRTFTVPAKVKGKVIFAVKTAVTVKGKSFVRFRDSRGRFASPKVK